MQNKYKAKFGGDMLQMSHQLVEELNWLLNYFNYGFEIYLSLSSVVKCCLTCVIWKLQFWRFPLSKAKLTLSSDKLIKEGFSFKYGIEDIYDQTVEYFKAKGLLQI